jgi:hypothetical protein
VALPTEDDGKAQHQEKSLLRRHTEAVMSDLPVAGANTCRRELQSCPSLGKQPWSIERSKSGRWWAANESYRDYVFPNHNVFWAVQLRYSQPDIQS